MCKLRNITFIISHDLKKKIKKDKTRRYRQKNIAQHYTITRARSHFETAFKSVYVSDKNVRNASGAIDVSIEEEERESGARTGPSLDAGGGKHGEREREAEEKGSL